MPIDNLAALCVAIKFGLPPETSFIKLEKLYEGKKFKNSFPWTVEDFADIEKFRAEGISWREISEYYGLSKNVACQAYKDHKKG